MNSEIIAEVVSKMTGIPIARIESAEAKRLLRMEEELHKMVVSQGGSHKCDCQGDTSLSRRFEKSESSCRIFYICRAIWCGEDAPCKVSGKIYVWRRRFAYPDRHVRIHGKT